jgi:hypothetical protein
MLPWNGHHMLLSVHASVVGVTLGSAGLMLTVFAARPDGDAFRTRDPLAAFVHHEYAPGDDYFAAGNSDTWVFRCRLTQEKDGFDGIALSELSSWAERSGPWEIFRREPDGSYLYVETRPLTDATCLEACASGGYLASGSCRWQRGWPAS